MPIDPDLTLDLADRVAPWISDSPIEGERYLWVMDKGTREITWKNRNEYSFWGLQETGRLQEIFKEMTSQLPPSLEATNKKQFKELALLKERVNQKYDGFLKAHSGLFGLIYRLLFAYFLSDYFQELKERLDFILASSFSNVKINDMTSQEIELISQIIRERELKPTFDIDWYDLSPEQFKAAYVLEKFARPIPLDPLTKEQVSHLLDQNEDKIKKFDVKEIERNLAKIEPRFLSQLNYDVVNKIDLSWIDPDQLCVLYSTGNLFDSKLGSIDLSRYSSKQINAILKKVPGILSRFSPKSVAENLAKIDLIYYKYLSSQVLDEIKFNTLSGDQFVNLFLNLSSYYFYDKNMTQLDLSLFKSTHISQIYERDPYVLAKFSPQTVAKNLSIFELAHLDFFSNNQVAAIDIKQISDDQLLRIKDKITNKQWFQINLAMLQTNTMNELFEDHRYLIQKLSPTTVAANLASIDTQFYRHLSNEQIQAIDYLSLKDYQKKAFDTFTLEKMKNYPKKNYYNPFGTNPSGSYHQSWYNFFGGFNWNSFPKDDDQWWDNFKSTSTGTQTDLDIILKDYCSCIDSAAEVVKKQKSHADPLYENLRKLIDNEDNRKKIKANPKLIFVKDAKDYSDASSKTYYKKLAIVFHPDKNKDREIEASELFRVVCEAYKILSEPKNKQFLP